ncbi:MAG: Tex-like N-terminal domain-containing protein, partial [Planctomycetota bacterium]
MTEDIVVIARDLKLPPEKVQHAVELLDAGNTIPFIARFRKDQTGGLDPEQVMAIKQRVGQLRALAERKTFVLKSIESQGLLNDTLANEIRQASSSRRVEDLYLPFKAKKQTLALTARQQGLEPLAEEIISGTKSESELAARALDFVRVDKGLSSVDEVMNGVGYLIAEKFSERSDVRRELRRMIWAAGSLCCKSARAPDAPANAKPAEEKAGEEKQVDPADAASASEMLPGEGPANEQPNAEEHEAASASLSAVSSPEASVASVAMASPSEQTAENPELAQEGEPEADGASADDGQDPSVAGTEARVETEARV